MSTFKLKIITTMGTEVGKAITIAGSLDKNGPLHDNELASFLSQIDFTPPSDYIEFMKIHNGAEGGIGENAYLQLWRIEELIEANHDYEVEKYAPGFFVFASSGGGRAYAFNKQDATIMYFDFIGMLISDDPVFCGEDFTAFLTYLSND
jgi:SMI1 / KNR4 family (SUKH-1)